MTYRTEFPDFPVGDMPKIPKGFEDTSWHNDTCPSFYHEALEWKLWVDYAEQAQREIPHGFRFTLCTEDGSETIAESDEWSTIEQAILFKLEP
jgi:hypothetical protein